MNDTFTLFHDIMMQCMAGPEKDHCIFLSVIARSPDGILIFVAEKKLWNPATDSNIDVGTETFTEDKFSAWIAAMRTQHWEFVP